MSQNSAILAALAKDEINQIDVLLWPVLYGLEKEDKEEPAITSAMLNREQADKEDQSSVATALSAEELNLAARQYSLIQEGQRVRRDMNIAKASRKAMWFSQLGIMFKRKRQLEEKVAKEQK